MNTIIVSDIHLGSSVSRSKELLSVLNSLTFSKLILNGDIFDDLDFTRLDHDDWMLLSRFRELSNFKNKLEVIWIVGNHDGAAYVLSRLLGIDVVEEHFFIVGGKKCLAIHGHQFDRFMTRNPILSFFASWIYLLIQRIDTRQQFVSRHLKRISKSWLRVSEKVARGAIRYGKIKGVEVVFCGHTHKQLSKKFDGFEYYNSGCWTDIPSSLVVVSNNGIEIREF